MVPEFAPWGLFELHDYADGRVMHTQQTCDAKQLGRLV